MATKKIKYPQVSVKWVDHFACYGEYSLSEIKKKLKKPCVRDSSGYLIAENDQVMAIAGTIDREDGKEIFSDIFYCLKADVIDIKYG